jgi:hypothetical protein
MSTSNILRLHGDLDPESELTATLPYPVEIQANECFEVALHRLQLFNTSILKIAEPMGPLRCVTTTRGLNVPNDEYSSNGIYCSYWNATSLVESLLENIPFNHGISYKFMRTASGPLLRFTCPGKTTLHISQKVALLLGFHVQRDLTPNMQFTDGYFIISKGDHNAMYPPTLPIRVHVLWQVAINPSFINGTEHCMLDNLTVNLEGSSHYDTEAINSRNLVWVPLNVSLLREIRMSFIDADSGTPLRVLGSCPISADLVIRRRSLQYVL